ncbi:hypothetical protein [Endozoicomonas montiporae]|nr:hypothetical protein [Endozoicomonas montiporae]
MVQYLAIALCSLSVIMIQSSPAADTPAQPTNTLEGCYARSDIIEDLVSGESDLKTSFISISKGQGTYFIKGFLWGANWHICEISREDGEALPVSLEQGMLIYNENYPQEDLNCRLEVEFKAAGIELRDKNNQCMNRAFACGVRTSIDGTKLPRVQNKDRCK